MLDPEKFIHQIINSAQEGIIVLDTQLRYALWNPFMEMLSGKSAQEVLGRHPWDVFPFLREHGIDEAFKRALAGETVTTPDALSQDAKGQTQWTSGLATPLRGPDGANIGVLVIVRDVTERKLAELKLAEAELRFRRLVENSHEAIVLMDAAAKKRYASPGIMQITGHSVEEFLALDSFALAHPDDLASAKETLAMVNRYSGQPVASEMRILRKDGSTCWIELIASNLIGVPGVNAIIVNLRDIDERKKSEENRKRLEAQIQHAQRLESLGVLAGGIAHDFNNLLAGILGNADLALIDLAPQAPARLRVQDIKTAGIRAAELTRQMLAYSGKGKFVIETLSIDDVVREMGHLLQTSISKKATLKYNLFGNAPPINADAAQIRQVVMNLIINASEALGEDGGIITISTGQIDADERYLAGALSSTGLAEGRYVYLEISDTGCGIGKEMLGKIFDPFFSTKFTGRGLGLAAVLGIVQGHKGAIKVYSEPGKGTSFKLLFPGSADAASPLRIPPVSTHEQWRGSGLVLVVDDEELLRDVNKHALSKCGFTVVTAVDGKDALDIFKQRPREFRLVILDMTMPRMSGEETFRELRLIRPDVRVLLTSGYNEQDATNRFVGKQLAGFIQKPFQISALISKVREILDAPPAAV